MITQVLLLMLQIRRVILHKMLPLTVVSILVLRRSSSGVGALLRQGVSEALGGAALNSANDVSGWQSQVLGVSQVPVQAANVSGRCSKSGAGVCWN